MTRTTIKNHEEIPFSNIKSISRNRYAFREIIKIKQENGKSIKFKKAYYGFYTKSDDFKELLHELKKIKPFQKSLFETKSGFLFFLSLSTMILSIIAFFIIDSNYFAIPIWILFFSISMIFTLFANQK